MEWWVTFLISIASSIVGAAVGSFFTWKIEKRKMLHQDKKERKAELKIEFEQRPRLEIKSFKDVNHGDMNSKSDFEFILLNIKEIKPAGQSLFFIYDTNALKTEHLCCAEYEFVNTGKTEISDISVLSNFPKTVSVVELSEREFLIKNGILSYQAWSNKRAIKPGETITFKVCYIKDQIVKGPTSAPVGIYMEDVYGILWHQPLFCPFGETDNSNRANRNEYDRNRNPQIGIECFKKPYLW